MTITYNPNQDPYYDDFDPEKNFMQILFNPGKAVQARELTQIQSILQDQIGSFANRIFQEGTSVVDGKISVNFEQEVIALEDTDDAGNNIDVTNFDGEEITGQTSGANAQVIRVDETNNYLYIQYLGGTLNEGETIETSNSPIYDANIKSSGGILESIFANAQTGIVYVGGYFITKDQEESIVVDPDNNQDHYFIGYEIEEDIVDSSEDSSLLDPASGSRNANAPGAHRYRVQAVLQSYHVNDTIPGNFYKIIEINNGQIIQDQNEVQYSDIRDFLATRTYEESGNYTVDPFDANLKAHDSDYSKVNVGLEAGLAYVHGYRIETNTTTDVVMNKARTTRKGNNISLYANYGPSFDIITMNGLFNVSEKEEVDLYSGDSGTGEKIGTVRVSAYNFNDTGGLRIHLFNTKSISNILTSVRSIVSVADNSVYANVEVVDGLADISNNNRKTGIFRIPKSFVSDIVLNEANYDIVDSYFGVGQNSNGNFEITANDQYTDFYSASQGGVFHLVDSSTNTEITNFTTSVDNVIGGTSSITITVNESPVPSNIDICLKKYRSQHNPRTKTLTETTETFTLGVGVNSKTLGNTDVFEIVSITKDPSTNPSSVDVSTVTLDNGQRDFYYDFGKISGLEDDREYEVSYRYFSHSGGGDYFAVNSYTNSTNDGFYDPFYEKIPTYIADNGDEYNLRDCIDFRRSVTDFSSGVSTVNPNSYFRLDFNYYLPRRDKIYVTEKGRFGVKEGIPSDEPELPNSPDNALVLYELDVPPYTMAPSKIEVNPVFQKRFTMRDIGKIEKRVEDLEYYVALNQLEKDAQDRKVVDTEGNDKIKNGILADDFEGHNVGNVYDDEYRISIDKEKQEARCPTTQDSVDFVESASSHVNIGNKLVTLPYSLRTLIDQSRASESMNVNPFSVFNWIGTMELDPATDNWIDTETAPDVVRNIDGVNDNWEALENRFGTEWNSWQTTSVGRDTETRDRTSSWGGPLPGTVTTTTTTTEQRRTGTRLEVNRNNIRRDLGERVVDTSVIPFMRSIDVSFNAEGMKPNTTLRAFFDDEEVTNHCTGLQTDAAGLVSGTFTIPNSDSQRFRTGTKVFKIVDDPDNPGTEATTRYTARGTLETKQNTIVSVDMPQVEEETVVDERTRTNTERTVNRPPRRWADPLAQSFLIEEDGGIFVKNIEVFFRTKDTDIPVTVHIVEMDNGYPTQTIVPNSERTLYPANVNTSSDGSVGTTFDFSDLVYLQEGTEYAFIILSNSDQYEAFVAEMSAEDLITGDIIASQPYAGSMFKSQNASTWSADQNRDIKFRMNVAEFDISSDGLYEMDSEALSPGLNLTTAMFNFDIVSMDETNVRWAYRFTKDETNFTNLESKKNINFDSQKLIEAGNPLKVQSLLVSENSNVSPVLHKDRMSVVVVNNDTRSISGTSELDAGIYVSRTVSLNDPSDDMKVIFDAIKPNNSDVVAYFKTGNFVPRYVDVSDEIDESYVGKTMHVYWRMNTSHSPSYEMLYKGSFVATKVEDLSGNNRIYIKSVSDISGFVDPVDWDINDIDNIFLVQEDDTIGGETVLDWSNTTTYSTGEYVLYNAELWVANEQNTDVTPTESGSVWSLVKSSDLASDIIEDTEQSWRPMKLEKSISPDVDTNNQFVEYTFIPDSEVEEEFTSFAVKLELRSQDNVNIPRVRSLRSIASF